MMNVILAIHPVEILVTAGVVVCVCQPLPVSEGLHEGTRPVYSLYLSRSGHNFLQSPVKASSRKAWRSLCLRNTYWTLWSN